MNKTNMFSPFLHLRQTAESESTNNLGVGDAAGYRPIDERMEQKSHPRRQWYKSVENVDRCCCCCCWIHYVASLSDSDSFFCALILSETLALYKSFTYLLTYLLSFSHSFCSFLFFRSLILSFIRSFVSSFFSFITFFLPIFIYLFIYLFIRWFIYSFIPLFSVVFICFFILFYFFCFFFFILFFFIYSFVHSSISSVESSCLICRSRLRITHSPSLISTTNSAVYPSIA